MTNDNLISGQVAMAVSSSSLKHSLRSATKAKKETLEEEAVLVHDEEKMMNDEEVTSVESNDDDDVERTMLTVALMKSVVDQRIPVDKDADDAAATCNNNNDDSLKQRLRKRRRRSGQDLERLERFQSTSEGGLAHSASATATADVKKPEKTISRPKPERTTSSSLRSLRTALDRPLSKAPLPSISENEFVLNSLSDQIPQSLHGTNIKLEASTMTSAAAKAAFPAPCPLLAATFLDDFTVAIVESPTAINDGLRKVNFTEPLCETTARMRGFSIDLDLGLEFADDSSASVTGGTSDIPSAVGRNRAFSFECFAFGINADEPLPPLEQSMSNANVSGAGSHCSNIDFPLLGRPRGDSIIFDPVSFQDGGILEQHALERATIDVPKASRATAPVHAPSRSSSAAVSASTKSSSSFAHGSAVGLTSVALNSSTLSLELLNKEGRIGIYLPDARRARIARFHAKRSKRIWRKRIKYDCRKKLADSRPRIKGRFVKRSDMDED